MNIKLLLPLLLISAPLFGAAATPADKELRASWQMVIDTAKQAHDLWDKIEQDTGKVALTGYQDQLDEGTGKKLPKDLQNMISAYEGRHPLHPLKSLMQIIITPEMQKQLEDLTITEDVNEPVLARQYFARNRMGVMWPHEPALRVKWESAGFTYIPHQDFHDRMVCTNRQIARPCCHDKSMRSSSNTLCIFGIRPWMKPENYHFDSERSDHPLPPNLSAAERAQYAPIAYGQNIPDSKTHPVQHREYFLQHIDAFAFDLIMRKDLTADDGIVARCAWLWLRTRFGLAELDGQARRAHFFLDPPSFIAADKLANPGMAQHWLTYEQAKAAVTASSSPSQSAAAPTNQ